MDRQPLYYTVFISFILIASSFYLSWSVDRGMGEVSVEKMSIERTPGRSIDFLVYSPRTANHYEPMPIVLTIHGLTGSKENLYAFNVELARRNFTVVSIDLPGHGDSTVAFNITDFDGMAQDAYAALRYVQTTLPGVDNETYGVLSHSLGFRVAIELKDFPVAPRAYVAVGNAGNQPQDGFVDFPDNLLFAIGSFDEIVSRRDALQAIRFATGNETAVDGITYGSLDNQTAYRLAFGFSDHASEVVDRYLITEAVTWLVQGVQGQDQLMQTRNPADQVSYRKNIATILSTIFIFVSIFPVMWLTYSLMPVSLKPRKFQHDTKSYSLRRSFEISSVLGGLAIVIFVASSILGINLEDVGIKGLSLMSGTGIILFLIIGASGLFITMWLALGKEDTQKALTSVGVEKLRTREHLSDILKSLVVAGVGIAWLDFWLRIAQADGVLLLLVRLPIGVRLVDTMVLTILAIPIFLVEAALVRGVLLAERDWTTHYPKSASAIFALFFRFVFVALLTIAVVFLTTAAGVTAGRIVLIGVIWVRILIVQILAAVLIIWTSLEFNNTWSAVFISSFILSLVIVTALPLV
ncbi:MAG: alpha/beta fold hydrolase [Candidatus Thorarchaeota archaeon]|nr:alpha/beta fold hydrolase [Candidatus Thorarchaeota archaeon]